MESFEEQLKQGILYGFIPKELQIEGRPELNVFPFNVLFMRFKQEGGKTISGSAVYNPNIDSLQQGVDKWSLRYNNAYGGNHWLIIEYDIVSRGYHGKKFVNGKCVGITDGLEWKGFFIHLTVLGLSNGEQCRFETVD
jgi:hypothetical protein